MRARRRLRGNDCNEEYVIGGGIMNQSEKKKTGIGQLIVWFLEGVFAGFGAILPGISGGTLCVAFGMYRPIIETLSDLKNGLKRYWLMLGVFIVGIGAGFLGLSGIADYLMQKNLTLVTCAFIGFIIGTFPELYRDAGEEKRTKASFWSFLICLVVMLCVLYVLKTQSFNAIAPGFGAYVFCGILWGLSFIVPGLSSSSLLLFFGLYQPMLAGISRLDFGVLIPMAIGMAACVLLLSQVVGRAYKKHFTIVSHGVIGIVAATTIMLFPKPEATMSGMIAYILCVVLGAVVSYGFTCLCSRLKENAG